MFKSKHKLDLAVVSFDPRGREVLGFRQLTLKKDHITIKSIQFIHKIFGELKIGFLFKRYDFQNIKKI